MTNIGDTNIIEDSESIAKLPFCRIKFALHQLVDVAIPLHIQFLKDQSEKLNCTKSSLELHSEQVKAAKSVQLLKADLYELENLNRQVKDEDQELFHKMIHYQIRDAIDSLASFMSTYSDILSPFPEIDAVPEEPEISKLVCYLDQENAESSDNFQSKALIQLQTTSPYHRWSFLKEEFLEIHSLIKKFYSLILKQGEDVDSIQNNISETRENITSGTQHLRKANLFKSATFPIAGAVIGGLMLGPVGALVGFKLMGTAAFVAGGSIIGYSAGRKLKKKQKVICDFELKPIAYAQKSSSNPEISVNFPK